MALNDVKNAYGTPATVACATLNLASDTNLLAGRESALVDNTSNLYEDYILSGYITVGNTPTINKWIEVWCYGILDDPSSPTYPVNLAGSDAAVTLSNDGAKQAGLVLAKTIMLTVTTSYFKYPIGSISVKSLFGGSLPRKFGFFITHNTAVNLANTTPESTYHQLAVTPVYRTVAS